jgi:hypothetical protein
VAADMSQVVREHRFKLRLFQVGRLDAKVQIAGISPTENGILQNGPGTGT